MLRPRYHLQHMKTFTTSKLAQTPKTAQTFKLRKTGIGQPPKTGKKRKKETEREREKEKEKEKVSVRRTFGSKSLVFRSI